MFSYTFEKSFHSFGKDTHEMSTNTTVSRIFFIIQMNKKQDLYSFTFYINNQQKLSLIWTIKS